MEGRARMARTLRRLLPPPALSDGCSWPRPLLLRQFGGGEIEPLLIHDPELGGSPMALVDARFLIFLANKGGRLCRRQDLPLECFLDLPTLRRLPRGHARSLRVVCLSYPWLQPEYAYSMASLHTLPRLDGARRLALRTASPRGSPLAPWLMRAQPSRSAWDDAPARRLRTREARRHFRLRRHVRW